MKKYVLSKKRPKKNPLKKLAGSPELNASLERILFMVNNFQSSKKKKRISFTFPSSFPNP